MSPLQQKPQATDLKQCLSELNILLDDRLFTASDTRQLHGKDTSFHEVHPPDAVTFVKSNEEVAEIVIVCAIRFP
jgi:D-lactate dehydrogenase (cytochrome)